MEEMELAYVPHPAAKHRLPPMPVLAPASPASRRAAASGGLAFAAVAGMALFSSMALMSAPRSSESAPAAVSQARAFEDRVAPPISVAGDPAPVEARASSPLPFAGDALGPVPQTAAADPYAAGAPAADAYAAGSMGAPRERHVLTSFDGTRTMTDGGVAGYAAEQQQQQRNFPPQPTTWNNPVRWVAVHGPAETQSVFGASVGEQYAMRGR